MPPNTLNYVEQFSVEKIQLSLRLGMPNLSLSTRELKAHFYPITFPAHFIQLRSYSVNGDLK